MNEPEIEMPGLELEDILAFEDIIGQPDLAEYDDLYMDYYSQEEPLHSDAAAQFSAMTKAIDDMPIASVSLFLAASITYAELIKKMAPDRSESDLAYAYTVVREDEAYLKFISGAIQFIKESQKRPSSS